MPKAFLQFIRTAKIPMAANLVPVPPPIIPANPSNPKLFATVDMGSNSFKMVIVRADPTSGKFLAIDRLKERVLLGLDMSATTTITTQPSISTQSQLRAIDALRKFTHFLQSHRITQYRVVATSAVREAANQSDFLCRVREDLGLDVDVLSGEDEGKYVYLGILQFLPYYEKTSLCIDIGGGSTEFIVGKGGKVIFAVSLRLGHVSLTEGFVKIGEISEMREHIQYVINQSGLVQKVRMSGFVVVVGSSGTIQAIERAVFHGYAQGFVAAAEDDVLFGDVRRDWRFSRRELSCVVESLCGEEEKIRRDGFFKRRSEFIIAGAILLEEIFEMLGIDEMEVSGYALGEGVIAERLASICEDYDLYVNARWRSIVRLATRLNNKKRMKSAGQCSGIGKDIFDGLRRCNELADNQNKLISSLDEKDLEYLEAACLLHNIGLFTGKKAYHKQSYHIIMNGDHLHGYDTKEVKLIALLARHHRKKFPKFDRASLLEFPKEVLSEIKNQPPDVVQSSSEDFESELRRELEHFEMVYQQKMSVVVSSSISESGK